MPSGADVGIPTRERTKVFVLLRSFDPGGAERQLLEVLKNLDKSRFDLTVATYYEGAWWPQAAAVTGIRLVCLRKRGTYDVVGFLWRTIRLARTIKPGVVYGYMTPADVVALVVSIATGARVIWGVRNSNTDLRPYGLLARLLFQLSKRTSWFTSAIIANSATGKRLYVNAGFKADSFFVVRNGIDVAAYQRRPSAKHDLIDRLGLSETAFLVGLVGRVDPQKGHETALRAIPSIAVQVPTAHFVFAGRGSTERENDLRNLCRALGVHDRVSWLGHVEDVAALYSALDVCVLPSSWGEGVPNAVAEAMACETPCVVSDVGDSAVVVGETGVVVPPSDPNGLAEGVIQLLRGDLRRRGAAARERIVEHFSIEKMVAATADILESVAGASKK